MGLSLWYPIHNELKQGKKVLSQGLKSTFNTLRQTVTFVLRINELFFQVWAHCVHIHDPQQDEYWRFSKVTALHIMQSRWRHHDQNILQAHYLVLCRYLVRVTYLLILTSCQEIGLSRCSLFINVIFLRGLLCHGSFFNGCISFLFFPATKGKSNLD